ncbi:MAG: hypothetical protein OXC11_12705 [Rhodospirillales bacterium]|nr:hypothetical protein [Rhodospirillales bacterium]
METNERSQFFLFFVGGALAILLLKLFIESLWFAPAVACAGVGFYAYSVWDHEARAPRFDAAGDHVYYLGFLYTLVSLAVSLALVGSRLGDDPDVIRSVLTGFGVAIASTILGMALRVVIGRGEGSEPREVVERAQLGLADAGRRLRAELDYTITEFDHFRNRIREDLEVSARDATAGISLVGDRADSASKSLAEVEQRALDASSGLAERVEELSQSAAALREFEAAGQRLAAAATSVADAAARTTGELDAKTRAVADALGEQADRIGALDLRKVLEARLAEVTALEARLAEAGRAVESSVRRLNEAWAQRDEAVEGAGRNAAKLSSALGEVTSTLRELQGAMANLDQTAATLDAFATQVSGLGEAGRSAEAHLRAFQQQVSQSATTVGQWNEHLTAAQSVLLEAASTNPVKHRRWRFWS